MNCASYRKILLTLVITVFFVFTGCGEQSFDLLIRDGIIIDGSGKEKFKADMGIAGDRITAVGDLQNAIAVKTIDAEGLIVAPGFIDVHTHCERGLPAIPSNENYIKQGVTSVVGGNCGGSPLDLDKYFTLIESKSVSTNIAVLIGHNTVRAKVMGMVDREPTDDEMEEMKILIDKAMIDGAVGFSTGLGYLPGMFSKTEEIIELNKVVGKYDGIYASHIRDQGLGMYESVIEAVRIGEEGGTRVQVSHLKLSIDKFWGETEKLDKVFREALGRGVEVYSDEYPYVAGNTSLSAVFPPWSLAGGKLLENLKDPEKREKIRDDFFETGRMKTYRDRDMLSAIQIANYRKDPGFEGKNLREILEMRGKEPNRQNGVELAMEIVESGDASCIFFLMDERDVGKIMNYPYNMIASDGGVIRHGQGVPHPRSYGTFPRVLGKYVRNEKVLSLEDAVYKMTSLPAKAFRFKDRGLLKKNHYADIVIFDKDKVIDTATFKDPHQYPMGISYVLVNGVVTVAEGELTGNYGGSPLYGPGKVSENEK